MWSVACSLVVSCQRTCLGMHQQRNEVAAARLLVTSCFAQIRFDTTRSYMVDCVTLSCNAFVHEPFQETFLCIFIM